MADIPKSLRSETKFKFETLLKSALDSRSNLSPKSTRTFHTISENESLSSFDNDVEKDYGISQVEADIHIRNNSKDNFILNKFLRESDRNVNFFEENEITSVIIPTPKPRKKWVKPSCTKETSQFQETAKASLEYLLTNEKRSSSLSSVQTYIIMNNNVEQVTGSISSEKIIRPSSKIKLSSLHKDSDSSIDDPNSEVYDTEIKLVGNHILANNDEFKNPEIYKHQTSPLPRNMHLEKTDKNVTHVAVSLESSANDYCSTNLSEKSDGGNEKKITLKYNNENDISTKGTDETHKKNFQPNSTFSKSDSIIEIVIHKTDKLKLEPCAIRPAIKVHIVNADTGEYLRISSINSPAISSKNNIYVEPIMTRSLHIDSEINQLRFPTWEESIIVTEDFQYFLSENHNLVIFFELLSFISLPNNYTDLSKQWYKIAWAFLKPKSKFESLNIEKMVRLQLYCPGKNYSTPLPKCHIFEWWNSKISKKYPATLYVTIKELKLPRMVIEKFRLKKTVPIDRSIMNQISNDQENKLLVNYHKEARRYCNFPNKLLAKFYSYQSGCLAIKFSNNGHFLACGMAQENTYFIAVFSTETFEQVFNFFGHEGLIYDIYWSKNDEYIISASSDCTASIWNLETKKFIQILPHMFFVYCCAMVTDKFIITGGYDKILRVWKKCGHDEFKLCQEIENHEGFITSLCAKVDDSSIYSCDSNGKVVEWTSHNKHHWKVNREIILAELNGTIINQILLNDQETKLLIHARDSVIRLVDLKSLCILQRFTQALNNTVQTFCTFCNCNRFVFCSSENGFIHVWDVNNGNSVAKYIPYNNVALHKDVEVHNVQFNPRKTQIAIASYNKEVPILLCGFDEQYKSFDLGLRFISN